MVQLDHVKERFPANLSGGQRQRVALARALVIRPDILLLDEPLGALDRKLRDRMQVELKLLQRRLGITTIIVTHDQEEALSLADRMAVMFEGQIVEIGNPAQLYEKPGSRQVMEFLGSSNLLRATVAAADAAGCLVVGSAGLSIRVADCERRQGEEVTLAIRPEHVRIAAPGDTGADLLKAQVVECVYKGSVTEVHTILADGTAFMVNAAAAEVARLGLDRHGTPVALQMAPERIQVFAT
jgi:ABC-type Fe3+/spermidine/putrescine transport system ATPase subunit